MRHYATVDEQQDHEVGQSDKSMKSEPLTGIIRDTPTWTIVTRLAKLETTIITEYPKPRCYGGWPREG